MQMRVNLDINSPKQAVWQAITDIGHCDQMITGILNLEVLEQPQEGLVGLKWRETRKVFGKESSETMWITEAVENEYYKTRAENHGVIYQTIMAIEDLGDTSRLSMTFSGYSESFFTNLMSKLMGFFIKKSMIQLLEQDLADIKAFVEAKQQS